MKYLKDYDELLLERKTDKKLYHGSPYIFGKFKNNMTFFSDNKNFAHSYSETKSMDMGMDNDTNIYTVKTLFSSRSKRSHPKNSVLERRSNSI